MNRKLLADGLNLLGIPYSESQLDLLELFSSELDLWNPRYGLVRASGDELVIKHFLDSLAGLPVLRDLSERFRKSGDGVRDGGTLPVKICDVGSGAGFPGVPLAVFLPEAGFSLVESSGRRVSFLRNLLSLMKLPNVRIEEKRAEDLVSVRADIVTFRAFHPFSPDFARTLINLKKADGWIVAYKGREERIREEMSAVGDLFSENLLIPVTVPFLEEERNLVLLR